MARSRISCGRDLLAPRLYSRDALGFGFGNPAGCGQLGAVAIRKEEGIIRPCARWKPFHITALGKPTRDPQAPHTPHAITQKSRQQQQQQQQQRSRSNARPATLADKRSSGWAVLEATSSDVSSATADSCVALWRFRTYLINKIDSYPKLPDSSFTH